MIMKISLQGIMTMVINKGDTWETPKKVFQTLDREFRFAFDVCAQKETAKCNFYWTIEDDALTKNWAYNAGAKKKTWLWCNPPYSNIKPWVNKAIEAQKAGVGVVMLVMSDTSVKWFLNALESVSEVRHVVNGRLAFLKDGVVQSGNNKGSTILVFDPHKIGWCQTQYIDRETFKESNDD